MVRLLALALILLTSLPGLAQAGDPCPIDLRFAEYTPPWRDRAVDLSTLSAQRTWLGLTLDGAPPLRVRSAAPGSAAGAAGLQSGDVITSLNGVDVTDRKHLDTLFQGASGELVLGVSRAGETVKAPLKAGPADPVFLGLLWAGESQECRDVSIVGFSADEAAALAKGAFDANRGFRCADAHTALAGSFESGAVVLIRGGTRILLTVPGWATTCVAVGDYDGDKLTPERLRSLLDGVSAGYVKDRHDNP